MSSFTFADNVCSKPNKNLHLMQSLDKYRNFMLLTVYFRSGGKSI
jgi:hypothetical protein